jgi:L-fuculose-phosphate aldolase
MNALGINRGTSGNLSARHRQGFLITPSGVPYETLHPHQIAEVTMDGATRGPLPPSSEWRIHRDVLGRRPEVGAVVHAHPPFATALACLGIDLPAVHYMIALAGGSTIRCAPYATFGTQELSDAALEALRGRTACLLGNHGILALGTDVEAAVDLALEVETLSEVYWRARQIGEPNLLTDAQVDDAISKFETYGPTSRD